MWRTDAEAQRDVKAMDSRERARARVCVYIYIYIAPQNCNYVISSNIMCVNILW